MQEGVTTTTTTSEVVPAVQPGEAVGDLPEVDLDDILESPEERKE